MTQHISVVGTGYVGLCTAIGFATKGYKVVASDIDKDKVASINRGIPPFHEPNLNESLQKVVENGHLECTLNRKEAVLNTEITFITVGTPSKPDESIDLQYVEKAAEEIGEALNKKGIYHLVVVKSTVIPGTTEKTVKPILEKYSLKHCGKDFGLCMNPEFLREGSALHDTLNPNRVIIGEYDEKSGDVLETLYRNFYGEKMPPLLRTNLPTAELIKYANNAFLAMKVSFINMIANLCQKIPGADVEVVAKGIGFDKRIGPHFLKAGAGWGGSCWPKDLKALKEFGNRIGVDTPLVKATLEVNDVQPYNMVNLAKELIGGLNGKRTAVLGLSFKPNTDDMREAVSIKIVNRLIEEGSDVIIYDPKALNNAKKTFGASVKYASSVEECLKNAECTLIVTEWDEFKNLSPEDFKLMEVPAVVDSRRIYDPEVFTSKVRFSAIGLGKEKFFNPAIAINAIIASGDKILLVKRLVEPYKETWSLPGGFVEYDETVEEALCREVEEETGLKVKPTKIVGVYSHPLRSPEKHAITICFETEIRGGSLKALKESSEVKFLSTKELPNILAFDHRKIIHDYIKYSQKI